MSEKVSLYNPRDTPPEQLEAMLTGREHLLKEVLDSLREQAGASSRQHWLLRGPRGIGKTHLTGIIHHRVSTDAELSKAYLPIWLGEADVYEVYSPATLLMRIVERLVEAVPGAKIGEALIELEGTGDEDALFEELAAILSEEAERQKRILLVLMENLDALFESFAPKQRTAQTRQLRSLLLDNPSFLFISTTPTRYLQELSNPKAPLFAQLKERKLSQLKVEEVGALFTKLAQITGRKELLGAGPDASLKQRIIHQLTGGLPRSVVMAFEILRDKEGIQALVEDLRTFLDAQTAYFEARLSRLAPRERAIVTTLALAEQNLTMKEIADKSRLPEKSLSTLVARLEQEGHVEAIDGSGGKGTFYGLSEGLFRIWYQYRKGRMLLEPLVRFLAYWYEPKELEGVVGTMQDRLHQEGATAGRAARLAFIQAQAALMLATSEHGRLERQRIWEECRRAVPQATPLGPERPLAPELQHALFEIIDWLFSGRIDEGRVALEKILAPYESSEQRTVLEATGHLMLKALEKSKERGFRDPEAFQVIAEYLESSRHAEVRELAVYVWCCVVRCLSNLRKYDELLGRTNIILASPEVRDELASDMFFSFVAASHAVALRAVGRPDEAVTFSKSVLDGSLGQVIPKDDSLRHLLLINLVNSLGSLRRYGEQRKVIEELAQSRGEASSGSARFASEWAAMELQLLRPKKAGKFSLPAFLDALDSFVDEYRETILSESAETISAMLDMRVRVSRHFNEKLAASSILRGLIIALLGEDVAKAAAVFLQNPAPFLLLFSSEEVMDWLKQMLEADIQEEQRQQLRLHMKLVELVDAVATRTPRASARLRQQLGRVPAELRELYASIIETLRKARD